MYKILCVFLLTACVSLCSGCDLLDRATDGITLACKSDPDMCWDILVNDILPDNSTD
jgi:hypothetical protein